jgi:hypothetical protein
VSNLSAREPKRDVCFWHKADMGGFSLLLRKLTPEPYSAGRKSLL